MASREPHAPHPQRRAHGRPDDREEVALKGRPLTVNGRTYSPPQRPVVVVCVDGCGARIHQPRRSQPAARRNLARLRETGTCLTADCVVPSFTNPNNLSIVTGRRRRCMASAAITSGTGMPVAEVMMNDPKYLRAARFSQPSPTPARRSRSSPPRTSSRAARHKMSGICFSAEKADGRDACDERSSTMLSVLVGIPLPRFTAPPLSEFVFAAGVKLMGATAGDHVLSTTDYIQHKPRPAWRGQRLLRDDGRLSRRAGRDGATVVATADHE